MIEVEIRGRLTEEEYEKLKSFLQKEGKFKRRQNREMYLLTDHHGFDRDPTTRQTDIRLRNTDGFCEIMIKRKMNDGNSARKEISLALKDNDLEKAKQTVKAFGCTKAIKMQREKEVYLYKGMEWEVVNCPPKNVKYFEAELEAASEAEIQPAKAKLLAAAKELGVRALEGEEMRDFLYWLDDEVNQTVEL